MPKSSVIPGPHGVGAQQARRISSFESGYRIAWPHRCRSQRPDGDPARGGRLRQLETKASRASRQPTREHVPTFRRDYQREAL